MKQRKDVFWRDSRGATFSCGACGEITKVPANEIRYGTAVPCQKCKRVMDAWEIGSRPMQVKTQASSSVEGKFVRLRHVSHMLGVNRKADKMFLRFEESRLTINLESSRAYLMHLVDGRRRFIQFASSTELLYSGLDSMAEEAIDVFDSLHPAFKGTIEPPSYTFMYGRQWKADPTVMAIAGCILHPALSYLGRDVSWELATRLSNVIARGRRPRSGSPERMTAEVLGLPRSVGRAVIQGYKTGGYALGYLNVADTAVALYRSGLRNQDLLSRALEELVSRTVASGDSQYAAVWARAIERNLFGSIMERSPNETTAARRLIRLMDMSRRALVFVQDIYRMGEQMNINLPNVYVMSEEDIHRLHDRLAALYKAKSSEIEQSLYEKALPELEKLRFSNKDYKIVVPQDLAEIVEEGEAMAHCVGSYVPIVAQGRTHILFLRDAEDNRVGTIEVQKGSIVQAFGPRNQALDDESRKFLGAWAKEKGLKGGGWTK